MVTTTTSASASVPASRRQTSVCRPARPAHRAAMRAPPTHAGQHADQGDADLHGRQEALRVLGQFARDAWPRHALALQHREPGASAETSASSLSANRPFSTISSRTMRISRPRPMAPA